MKALFRNHFPFVEGTPEEELDSSQLLIKQTYDKLYPSDSVSVTPVLSEESGSTTETEIKTDRLRDIPTDEQVFTGGNRNKSSKHGGTGQGDESGDT